MGTTSNSLGVSRSRGLLTKTGLYSTWCLLLAATNVSRAVDVTEYESGLIGQRNGIGQIVLEIESEDRIEREQLIIRSKRQIWQDGAKRRCDEMREDFDLSLTSRGPPCRHVAFERESEFFFWSAVVQPDGSYPVAHWERTTPDMLKTYDHSLPFDARWFGVSPSSPRLMRGKPYDAIVGAPNRTEPAVVRNEGEKIVVEYERPGGATIMQRYARCGTEFVLEHFTLKSPPSVSSPTGRTGTMDCRYPAAAEHGVPYPEWVEIKQINGDAIEIYNRSTFRVQSINAPIPPSVFSIEAVGLPIGIVVLGSAIPPSLENDFHHAEWDGKKLVSVSNSSAAADDATPSIRTLGSPLPTIGARRAGYGWIVAGSVLLLVSAIAFWVYRSRTAVN